ncbi:dehalogenase [Desulfitobacterium sp.]|uniref:dehalogenase n=1 Tax=Desulfitobacterium sp. TaxID=49981 RepID=UPI002B1FE7BA|nr:dehalogenase [Desulfitobacterium sp.]MEA4901524.1 dehalogenase [Desulfitobacterium sp.]
MFDVVLIFVVGMLFLAGILALRPYANKGDKKKTILNWFLYGIWFLITCVGLSFVVLNSRVGHVKATSTGVFLFFGLSIIIGVLLARLLGFIGNKQKQQNLTT